MQVMDKPSLSAEAEGRMAHIVDTVVRSRMAVRAFRSTPVRQHTLREILDVARFAPSNSNSQPWYVHVLQGEPKRRLSDALMLSHEKDALPPSRHFPDELPDLYKDRQADFGARYYKVLGIARDDEESRYRQTGRNYSFFDAPVGLIFSIDTCLTKHSWLDFGLFLQTLMLAAKSRGLDTCPQVSFVRHEPVIREVLQLPPDRSVACGMSMGYAEPGAGLNQLGLPRAGVDEFATFLGCEEDSA